MRNSQIAADLVIVAFYLGVVALLVFVDSAVGISLLAIPWSIPLMMLSGLILHMTTDGGKIIMIGCVVGAALNSLLFLFLRNRS